MIDGNKNLSGEPLNSSASGRRRVAITISANSCRVAMVLDFSHLAEGAPVGVSLAAVRKSLTTRRTVKGS